MGGGSSRPGEAAAPAEVFLVAEDGEGFTGSKLNVGQGVIYRDVLVFPQQRKGEPFYRSEAVPHSRLHEGTHRTAFFDVNAPRERHRAEFLKELDDEASARETQDTAIAEAWTGSDAVVGFTRSDEESPRHQDLATAAPAGTVSSQTATSCPSTDSSNLHNPDIADLLFELRGSWAQQAEIYFPHLTTISTERNSQALALAWGEVHPTPAAGGGGRA